LRAVYIVVRAAIVEENHYYPQGLKMAGLCAKAFAKPANPYNYQGTYSEEGETGWNDFELRSYDPNWAAGYRPTPTMSLPAPTWAWAMTR
jgi:hypothetical protein